MVVIAQHPDVERAREGAVVDERAARRSLRTQIARLERELAEAVVSAFPHAMGGTVVKKYRIYERLF